MQAEIYEGMDTFFSPSTVLNTFKWEWFRYLFENCTE